MTGVRGRPRRVNLTEPVQNETESAVVRAIAEPEELATMPPAPLEHRPENTNQVVSPLGHGILTPRKAVPTRERMAEVLELLGKAVERGFTVMPDAEGVSVTITKGRCSECLNITNTNAEFIKALNRVNVASAAAAGRRDIIE